MSGMDDCPRCGDSLVLPDRVCVSCLTAENFRLLDRVAELEAMVARVTELCADVHRQCAQAQYDPELQSIAGFADDVENALAGPAKAVKL